MTLLYACAECGCTDVEVTAWIHVNTGEVIDSEAAYCPQCAHAGYDGDIGKTSYLEEVGEPCPFDADRVLPDRD